ncbi:LysR family transcriptional regulator ArgP [Acinetobacter stercoris]|uniref:Chromosome initiation inhibitor n=1 Tax=Acinetobacter stercoris TaxID=2126983 RepID=A0A2U3MYQ3_9GAMM|nr:LysR family transcriptional regulator ArgP [Acinetobacter stercoris]SPL70568.1 Chromosome initiation inhibitor [Acinetobacter stercoris]
MLDHKQCEAFLTVAETGSFEHAGAKLCITPSAVTLRVQALEKNLGQLLLIRGRPCTLTQSGKEVLEYLQHTRLLEQNLLHSLTGQSHQHFYKITIACNADSLATWLLPNLQQVILKEKILLELKIDDQSHTDLLLETGLVNACITTKHQAMQGCEAKFLGKMRYKMVSSPAFSKKWFAKGINREKLRTAPAIIFNEKDHIHFEMILKLFGLIKGTYPYSYIPSSDSFVTAIKLGLGYGMVPELQLEQALQSGELIEILPEATIDIDLYWHHWKKQSAQLNAVTEHIIHASKSALNQ